MRRRRWREGARRPCAGSGASRGVRRSHVWTCPLPGLDPALVFGCRSVLAQGLGGSHVDSDEPSPHESRLGPAPGAGANPLGGSPGAGEAVLEKGLGSPGPRFIPEPFPQAVPEIFPEGKPTGGLGGAVIGPPTHVLPGTLSPYGSLALPPGPVGEGPADGLTLDQAIERLIRSNLDLCSKSFEIPQAEADVLTAGLRANPILYSDVQCCPTAASRSDDREARPSTISTSPTRSTSPTSDGRGRWSPIAPSASCRRSSRTPSAFESTTSTPSSSRFWRPGRRSARREGCGGAAGGAGPDAGRRGTGGPTQYRRPAAGGPARGGRVRASRTPRSSCGPTSRALGALLKIPPAEAERLAVRGSLHDTSQPPASVDALLRLALASRPDLVAYRLGVRRAEADVALAVANRYPDLYLPVSALHVPG